MVMTPKTRMKRQKEIYAKYRPIINGLVQDIKAFDHGEYDGLHGVNYSCPMVSGGGYVRDLSDTLLEKERYRDRLVKELNRAIDDEMDELDRLDALYMKGRKF